MLKLYIWWYQVTMLVLWILEKKFGWPWSLLNVNSQCCIQIMNVRNTLSQGERPMYHIYYTNVKLEFLHQRMLCAKFGWDWHYSSGGYFKISSICPSGFGEEDENSKRNVKRTDRCQALTSKIKVIRVMNVHDTMSHGDTPRCQI